VIYMILWGIAHWRGIIQEPVGDFLSRVTKIAFIAALALKAPIYLIATGNWVYRTPQRFLDALAPIVPNTLGNARPSNAIDIVLAQGTVASERFQSGIASTGYLDLFGKLSLFLSGLTIELFTIVILAIMMATVLIAKVLLAVLLAVGPLFVAGMTAIKVQLDAALVAIPPGSIASLSQFAGFFFVSVVILLVMFQVPAIGAALGNGVQVGTLGVSHTAMRAMGSASRSLSMGLKATPAAPAAAAWQRAVRG